jgi:glutathione reductase (NADPH)
MAIADGRAFADTVFGGRPRAVDHAWPPTAVFSLPPVATVGMPEHVARAHGHAIDVYCTRFRPLEHTLSRRDTRSMFKVIVDRASDRVLGVHMVGNDAPEILQGVAIAMRCGATKAMLDETLPIHPTSAEELVLLRTKAT